MTAIRDVTQFESLVRDMLESGIVGSFGKLHIITLASQENGLEWEQKLPKISAIAESVLAKRLQSDESYFSAAPGRYLLVFPRLNEVEGTVRATVIAQDIKRHLFGETGSAIRISTRVLPLTLLNTEVKTRTSIAAMDEILSTPSRHGIVLDAMFQPVWDSERQMVIGNRGTIRRQFEGHELFGPAVLFGGSEDPLALDVNTILRNTATPNKSAPATLFVPQIVNARVLGDIEKIRDWVAQTARFHAGDLIIELAGGGLTTVGRPRLRELIQAIRAAGAEVAIQTVPDVALARRFREYGVRYLCINESQISFAGFSPSATMALFTVIAHEVRNIGLQLCLWNTRAPQEIKRSIPLGYRYFSGGSIGETTRLRAPPGTRTADQIYA